MKKYLIVSDLDGTLADTDHQVNETTKAYIKELLDQGHTFYISTGRMQALVQDIALDIDPRVRTVGSNGGIIQTEDGYEKHLLDKDEKLKLYNHLMEEDVPALYFSDKDVLFTHFIPEFFVLKDSEENTVKMIEDVHEDLMSRDIINALCLGHHLEDPLTYLDPIKSVLKDKFDLTVTSSNITNIEIFSKEASKGNALKKLMKKHNKTADEVIVFGDGFNDVSMFQVAGTAVAMDNAPDAVKEYATHTTVSNGENGVVKFLRNILK